MLNQKMKDTLPQIGIIQWVGIRPVKRLPVTVVQEVEVDSAQGLVGDHYAKERGDRQVTLIQKEHLSAVASILQKEKIDPALTRRNIVVSGINLLSLTDRKFRIGEDVILQMTGQCHPCSRMEENLGSGGYNAMRGHGGMTAKVIKGGKIRVGDEVKLFKE
ncbi:MAG: MOSC domain-containing protein [Bacteroidetes bacterium]|nr:MOSC domain-containing protein [Bacteroidota bacterium]